MKVAFTTEDLTTVDAHFGWAKKIAIYEVLPESSQLVEVVEFDGDLKEDGTEDKLEPKLAAIRDCPILYVAAIGGKARRRPGGRGAALGHSPALRTRRMMSMPSVTTPSGSRGRPDTRMPPAAISVRRPVRTS